MVLYMKQNIKIFLIALLIGIISCYIVCYKLDTPLIGNALDTKVTIFYVGTYNNQDDALKKEKTMKKAIIYEENNIYRVIIGVYQKEESIDLMSSYFIDQGISFQKKEIKVNNEFIKKSKDYELLLKTSEKEYFQNINNSLLTLFHEYSSN